MCGRDVQAVGARGACAPLGGLFREQAGIRNAPGRPQCHLWMDPDSVIECCKVWRPRIHFQAAWLRLGSAPPRGQPSKVTRRGATRGEASPKATQWGSRARPLCGGEAAPQKQGAPKGTGAEGKLRPSGECAGRPQQRLPATGGPRRCTAAPAESRGSAPRLGGSPRGRLQTFPRRPSSRRPGFRRGQNCTAGGGQSRGARPSPRPGPSRRPNVSPRRSQDTDATALAAQKGAAAPKPECSRGARGGARERSGPPGRG